jgi:hypothetical protein
MAGKKEALFKPFLFADQDLDALVADIAPRAGALAEAVAHLRGGQAREAEIVLGSAILTDPGDIGAWHRLTLAAAQARLGKTPAAVRTLRYLLDGARESRIRLWAWHALRRLGAEPPADLAGAVEGVVVEVGVESGVETVAVYADGTARCLRPAGDHFIWDRPDDRLKPATDAVLAGAAVIARAAAPGRLPGEPPAGTARMTVLLPAGPRSIEEPADVAAAEGGRCAPLFVPASLLRAAVATLAGW